MGSKGKGSLASAREYIHAAAVGVDRKRKKEVLRRPTTPGKVHKTTTGSDVMLDGDLLAIMELLYREVTAKRALERTFDDMVKEIHHLIDQMSEEEI